MVTYIKTLASFGIFYIKNMVSLPMQIQNGHHMSDRIKERNSPDFTAPSSNKRGLGEIPNEIALKIVQHLLPKDAINFESVSHASREKIANNPQIWAQHGMRPPISLDTTSTLKQLWLSHAKTLSPEIRRALFTLNRPLNIFSRKALADFSLLSRARHNAMETLNEGVQEKDYYKMLEGFESAVSYSRITGLELPTVSEEMKAIYITAMQEALSVLWNPTEKHSVRGIESHIAAIRDCAEKSGTAMPPLPVDKIRSVYLADIYFYVDVAQRDGRCGATLNMRLALEKVDELAKQAEVEMPTISTEGMNEDTKSACFEILAVLTANS